MNKYLNLKSQIDRLGRNILHLITQYDLFECIPMTDFEVNNYFVKDFNGETPIDYICIYNSKGCFSKIIEKFEIDKLYKELRESGISFIEKCVL